MQASGIWFAMELANTAFRGLGKGGNMQVALETLEHYSHSDQERVSKIRLSLGRWLAELFGCQHKEMSRPFSRHGETYRVCIACGARRQFDGQTWNSAGPYYFKPARTSDLLDIDTSAIKCL
jgi:hypothetical protein